MNTNEKTQKWENLKLYKYGKAVPMPDNFVAHEVEKGCLWGGHYMFELKARFKDIEDAKMFAKAKSKKAEEWQAFCVTKNLSGDPLGEYYVYLVLCTTYPYPEDWVV